MALQFQPPDWLLQEYLNRKSPIQQASEGAQNVLGSYITLQNNQQTQQLAQEDRDIKLAGLSSEGGTQSIDTLNAIRASRGLPPLTLPQTPQIQSQPQAQTQMPFPQGSPNMNEPLPSPSSPILAHWGQLMPQFSPQQASPIMPLTGTPTGKPTIPDLGSDPAIMEFNQIGSQAYLRKYGIKGMAKVKTALDIEKGLQDKNKPNVTIGQYGALQTGETDALTREFPEGIPSNLATSALNAQSRNVRITTDPYGNPIRVPVSGGAATPVSIPQDNYSDLQKRLNPIEYKDWQKEVNDFDNDAVVKADRTMLATLNQINSEISNYNPALTGPLQSQQARAIAREVGALTDSDIARQSLDPSLLGRVKKAISIAATGKLPADQLELLKQTVKTINNSASNRIGSVARERASRKSQEYGGKISPDELMKSLRLPTSFSVEGGKLPPDKQARLEELRAKKAAGTLR